MIAQANEIRAPAEEHKDPTVPVVAGTKTAVDAPSACRTVARLETGSCQGYNPAAVEFHVGSH